MVQEGEDLSPFKKTGAIFYNQLQDFLKALDTTEFEWGTYLYTLNIDNWAQSLAAASKQYRDEYTLGGQARMIKERRNNTKDPTGYPEPPKFEPEHLRKSK